MKKYRNAQIEVVANGFIVKIGCQKVVAETPEKLLSLITDYLNDPDKAWRKLLENSIAYDCTSPRVAETPWWSIPYRGKKCLYNNSQNLDEKADGDT